MRRMMPTAFWLAAVLLGLGACTPVGQLPMAPISPSPEEAIQLPIYRLKIGDVLNLRLPLNPELDEQVTVGPDGRISTTLASDVPAYGRTIDDVSKDLESAYSKELHQVKLALVLLTSAPDRVYVAGEVAAPGELVTTGPGLTLLQAISRAGGIKEDGTMGKVIILRRGIGDTPTIFAADYRAATRGLNPMADVRLAPYDIIFVPKTGIGEVYKAYHEYLQQFISINWGFTYDVNPITTLTTINGH